MQDPAGLVKNPLPVRNSSACAQVPDCSINNQPPHRNGKIQEGVQTPKGSMKKEAPVRSDAARDIHQGILFAFLSIAS
jgi:hypothetical protein